MRPKNNRCSCTIISSSPTLSILLIPSRIWQVPKTTQALLKLTMISWDSDLSKFLMLRVFTSWLLASLTTEVKESLLKVSSQESWTTMIWHHWLNMDQSMKTKLFKQVSISMALWRKFANNWTSKSTRLLMDQARKLKSLAASKLKESRAPTRETILLIYKASLQETQITRVKTITHVY